MTYTHREEGNQFHSTFPWTNIVFSFEFFDYYWRCVKIQDDMIKLLFEEKSYFCVAKTSRVMISSILKIWALEEHFDRVGFSPILVFEIFVPLFDIPTTGLVLRYDICQNWSSWRNTKMQLLPQKSFYTML